MVEPPQLAGPVSVQEEAARILVVNAALNFWAQYRAGRFDEIGPAQRRILDAVDRLVEAQQRAHEKTILKGDQ